MPLHIGYGLIAAQRPPESTKPWSDVYADAIGVAEAAEAAGFDSVWVTEHHFTDDGYLSSLFPMLAAMAARTQRVLLGTNIALAPLYHPLRLAEDAAAVAAISGGRLLLGLGIGYRDEEFLALGIPKTARIARLTECVEVCRKAWTGLPFAHKGPLLDVKGLVVRPAPPGPPEIWLGGWVDATIRRAARLGDGYISPVGDLADTQRRVEILDSASSGARRGIATTTFTVLTPRGRELPGSIRTSLVHVLRRYGEWYSSSSDRAGGSDVGRLIEMALQAPDPAAAILAGTGEQVAAALSPLAAAFAPEREHHLVVRMHHPGVERSVLLEQISLFASEVMPALRAAAPI